MSARNAFLAVAAALCAFPAVAQKDAPKSETLLFTNGDQLSGKLVKATGGNVTFKSDVAGEQTVSFDKIKELRSSTPFVVIRKDQVNHRHFRALQTQQGSISVTDGKVFLTPSNGAPEVLNTADIAFLIDEPTFQKEVAHKIGLLDAWTGTITGGASVVRSTQTSTTLTGAISLVRALPTVPYLVARNRTTFNVAESYGKQRSPAIPPTTNPVTPDALTVTNIFHADAERDEYFSESRFYALATATFDHNYSQGLQLQQVYGGGFGWTPIKSASQTLDLKGDAHYEMQQFFAIAPAAPQGDVHLFGSTFSETYTRNLPKKMVFTENANYLPGWTYLHAYSANITAALSLPVFKRLSATISTTDNYLNNPQQYYKKNSYQFVTGVTYNIK